MKNMTLARKKRDAEILSGAPSRFSFLMLFQLVPPDCASNGSLECILYINHRKNILLIDKAIIC